MSHGSFVPSCPKGSHEITVRGTRYCLLACPGVLQNGVDCGMANYRVGVFSGAIVCALPNPVKGRLEPPQHPDPLPPEICSLLPQGCSSAPTGLPFDAEDSIHPFETNVVPPSLRCSPTDPECGPVSYRHVCLAQAGYDPKAPRIPWSLEFKSESRFRDNHCQHDGDCFAGRGCGRGLCLGIAYARSDIDVDCNAPLPNIEEKLQRSFCGCVHGVCAWFEQQ
jgi:hypothetical protein